MVADGHAVLTEENAEQSVEVAADLREERRHVGSAERDAGGADDLATRFLDLLGVGVARGLAPGIVGIGDVPLLAHLVDEIRREGDRLRRRIVVGAEAIAVAFRCGERRVEADADHVDHHVLLEHRHAGETDIGEEAAHVRVDLVFDQELLDLAPPDVGLGLIVRDDQLDRPAIDATRLVDAVDRHLQAHQGGLAACGTRTRQGLLGPDLVRFGLAEGGLPWRRHQHGGAERASGGRAISDQAAARHLPAVPEFLSICLFAASHCDSLRIWLLTAAKSFHSPRPCFFC